MLRYDGQLLECGGMHPYIKYENRGSVEKSIYDLFTWMPKNIIWFYQNSLDADLKKLLQVWVKSITQTADFNINISDNLKEELDLSNLDNTLPLITNKHDLEMYFLHINNQCNQEFCRVRTSGKTQNNLNHGSIYFRISSNHFNWFNAIWQVVYDNRNFITDVTICADEYSGKGSFIYKHKDLIIDRLPCETFLTLSGNPLVENYEKTNTTINTHTSALLIDFLDKKAKLLKTNFVFKECIDYFPLNCRSLSEETNLMIKYIIDKYYELLNE